MPPTTIRHYNHATLESRFATAIAARHDLSEVEVQLTSSRLADLDANGASDDLFGTALLRVGDRFKSFIYLLRADGAARFLDNSGQSLNPMDGLRTLPCQQSRPWMCHPNFREARRVLEPPRISLLQFDSARAGLELIIHSRSGNMHILNALELFTGQTQ